MDEDYLCLCKVTNFVAWFFILQDLPLMCNWNIIELMKIID